MGKSVKRHISNRIHEKQQLVNMIQFPTYDFFVFTIHSFTKHI